MTKKTKKRTFQSTLWDSHGTWSSTNRAVDYLRSGMEYVPMRINLGTVDALEQKWTLGMRREYLDEDDEIIIIEPALEGVRDILITATGAISRVMHWLTNLEETAYEVDHELGYDVATITTGGLCSHRWFRPDKKYAPWQLTVEVDQA